MTKLHFIAAHKRVGPMRKSLGMEDGTNRNYPPAGKVSVIEDELDTRDGGVNAYRETLLKHAKLGHALYRGLMQKVLYNESRRGMTDKEAKTEFLVLDIDGMPLDIEAARPAKKENVRATAEAIIAMLPKELANVSYVAVASSSFATKPNSLSVHLHFLLDKPVEHRKVKLWLDSLNYTQNAIYERLGLTASKMRVKNIIDPCLGEPARLVYIAPPFFGPKLVNPFTDDDERIIAVEKSTLLLDLDHLLDKAAEGEELIRRRKEDKRKDCLKKAGMATKNHKMKQMNVGGEGKVMVVTDPPPATLYHAFESDGFIRYNMGGKQNNAYYVRNDNPEVVFSFIPEEPAFMFSAADPVAYSLHIEKYGRGAVQVIDEVTGEVRNVLRDLYIDQTTDLYVTIEYDEDADEIIDFKERRSLDVASEWMKFHGRIQPDPIAPIYSTYDPRDLRAIYQDGEKTIVNRFHAPALLRPQEKLPEASILHYGNGWLIKRHCPVLSQVVLNMLGDDLHCFEHFINWLAYIVQTRSKAETAWLLGGEQGTGKGLFFKKVLQQIFGKYAVQNSLEGIADDKFNEWMVEPIVVMVDEFNMKGANSSLTKTASMLKTRITEPTMMLRKMHVGQVSVNQYLNFIFGTNDLDALTMNDKRRINIAPRQQRMLENRLEGLKKYREDYDDLMETEVKMFARFLHSYTYSTEHATTIIENQARKDVIEAGMNAVDQFFENLTRGHFDAFIGILDKPAQHLDHVDLMLLTRVKSFLIANLEHVNTGQPCYLHKDDLCALFHYMSGKPVSDVRLGRMLSTHDIEMKRREIPVGYKKKMATRPKCVEVVWHYPDEGILTVIKANHTLLIKNTQPIDSGPSSEEDRNRRIRELAEQQVRK